ncbi:MAG: sigma-70 family RNA polymerase sigma factor [Ilumatobacteraceae bacterium]
MTTPARPSADEATRRIRLDSLFVSHAAAVFAFARRRASRVEAEDVVSETFLVAWRRLDDVPESSLPWLLGVARRVLANRRRADARQAALRSRLGPGERDVGGPPESSQRDASIVLAALAALPPAERDAITLLAWEGLTADEAAIVLDCSRATFYVRVHRARQKLASQLGVSTESSNTKEVC